jgi:membrane associated rhomboid family serine protease
LIIDNDSRRNFLKPNETHLHLINFPFRVFDFSCYNSVSKFIMGSEFFRKRSQFTITTTQAIFLSTLFSFCVSTSLSQPLFHVRRRGNLGKKGIFARTVTPVSYRSQRVATSADAHDEEDDRYDMRVYRPWNVDFPPKSPGHYSWTSKIVMVNVFCYALQVFFPSITNKGVKLSDRILRGEDLHRLVTPMFLHGGVTHLLTNVYSLQAVGNDVERYFGPGRYLCTYLLSGVVANYVSAVKTPNPSLGASGAVFGIVGAYYVFLNRNMVSDASMFSIHVLMLLDLGLLSSYFRFVDFFSMCSESKVNTWRAPSPGR